MGVHCGQEGATFLMRAKAILDHSIPVQWGFKHIGYLQVSLTNDSFDPIVTPRPAACNKTPDCRSKSSHISQRSPPRNTM